MLVRVAGILLFGWHRATPRRPPVLHQAIQEQMGQCKMEEMSIPVRANMRRLSPRDIGHKCVSNVLQQIKHMSQSFHIITRGLAPAQDPTTCPVANRNRKCVYICAPEVRQLGTPRQSSYAMLTVLLLGFFNQRIPFRCTLIRRQLMQGCAGQLLLPPVLYPFGPRMWLLRSVQQLIAATPVEFINSLLVTRIYPHLCDLFCCHIAPRSCWSRIDISRGDP